MTVKANHRELLKAMALGDSKEATRLSAEVPDTEKSEYYALVTGLFCVMLEHRFKEDVTLVAIVDFVNEMRYDYRDAVPPIKPWAIEGTIRASLGEEHLLDEIEAGDTLSAEYQVIRKIVLQSEEVTENIDKFLDDAGTLVAAWGSEES